MAFDTSCENMVDELAASKRQVESRLFARQKMIERYHGPFYEEGVGSEIKEPENPAFEWIATVGAQIVAGDPQVIVRPTRADRPDVEMRAEALGAAINRLARNGDHKRRWRKLFVDWCFGPAITCVWRTPYPYSDRGPLDGPVHRPDMRRVSPPLQRYDPRATDWEETRWRGHGTLTSKSVCLEAAKTSKGWRREAIAALQTEEGLKDRVPKDGQGLKGRDDFWLWTVWFPEEQLADEYTPEAGFFGTWRFYAETSKSSSWGEKAGCGLVEIRDPIPQFGPRQGPYYMSGMHYVPDNVHPLSIMVAIENIAQALRLQSTAMDSAMQQFKRFFVYGGKNASIARMLKNAKHGAALNLPGFEASKAGEYTIGGPDAAMAQMYEFRIQQMDRRSGLTDSMKGQVQSGVTATAEAGAQAGANARLAGNRDEFYSFGRDNYQAQAEMIDGDDQFFMPLPPELAAKTGRDVVGLRGGRKEGESFEDYELAIEPFSMMHRTEQERMMAAERELAIFQTILPLMEQPMGVAVDWQGLLKDQADAMGNNLLPKRLNKVIAQQIGMLMLQGALQAQDTMNEGQAKPQAKAAKDTAGGRAALAQPAKPAPRQSTPGAKSGAKAPKTSGAIRMRA